MLRAELGSAGLVSLTAMAGSVPLKNEVKSERRKGGKYLDTKGRIGIYDGTRLKCEHGRRRSQCKEWGGSQVCEHGRRRPRCKECGGESICEHGRERSRCENCKVSKRSKGVRIVECPDPVFFAGAFADSSRDDMSDS